MNRFPFPRYDEAKRRIGGVLGSLRSFDLLQTWRRSILCFNDAVLMVADRVSFQRALHLLLSDRSLPRRLLQPLLARSAQLEPEKLPEEPGLSETNHEQHQQPYRQSVKVSRL